MDLANAIRLRIKNLMIENNLNISKLSTLAGLPRSLLYKFMAGERKIIRLESLNYICEALNMKLKDFFDDELFDNINDN